PRVADLFWDRVGGNQRRPRYSEPGALSPRAARLAGRRIHGTRLEPEGAPPSDRVLGYVPPIVPGDSGTLCARPVQPPAGARAALPGGSGVPPRPAAGGRRFAHPAGGRPRRFPAAARVHDRTAGQLWAENLAGRQRGGALPARPVHVPVSLDSLSVAANLR